MIGVGDRDHLEAPRATPDERLALAVLVSIQGLGPITLGRLLATCGSATSVLRLATGPDAPRRLIEAAGRDAAQRDLAAGVAVAIADGAMTAGRIGDRIRDLDLQLVVPSDAAYPARLRAIELPPALLFVHGNLESLDGRRAVAVVGTRRPSDGGRRTANRISAALARARALVVSGLAIGIDGAAHSAVVDAGGRTVAFIGGGHGRLFPMAHDRLAAAIVASGGAVASEYAPDTEPTKGTFPRRNRLISGAADAVVVVEAGARSGALLTASWALEQGRECFIVPGAIDAPMSAGCLGFLRDWPGAARIVSGIPQLLDDLGLPASAGLEGRSRVRDPERRSTTQPPTTDATIASLEPRDALIARAILDGAATVDELVAVTGLAVGAVLGALTRLEGAGLVRDRHGRYDPSGALGPVVPTAGPRRVAERRTTRSAA